MDKRRVVVTGLGTVNPLGNDVETSWTNIKQGKVGIAPITAFDTSGNKVKLAAEVKGFEPELRIRKRDIKHLSRFTRFAMYAAEEAIERSGILESIGTSSGDDSLDGAGASDSGDAVYTGSDIGVIISSGIGGIDTIEEEYRAGQEKGFERIDPFTVSKSIANMAAAQIAILHRFQGMNSCPAAACAGGNIAIGDAFHRIRDGYENAFICGGAEGCITEYSLGGFAAIRALSVSEDVNRASIPFDKDRNGFVMGEGAGILVLEELEHAKKRNAPIIAEIVGYGINCDAYHITALSPNGKIGAECIRLALKDAGIEPECIDYINAHGTSTVLSDFCETMAIKEVFGEYAKKIPVSGTKSMTGHMIGAAGGMEAVISCLTIRDGFIPPTMNLLETDPRMDLDYVPMIGRNKTLNYVMSNGFGFGGHNACLIFRAYREE